MSELLSQLGIDPKLLLSQGVNFGLVIIILTFLVYKPLVKILNERKQKIEFGLRGAEEAERRLSEIEEQRKEKIQKGEEEAFRIVKSAEEKSILRQAEIISQAESKAEEVLKGAAKIQEQRRMEALASLTEESRGLIKKALTRLVSLKPEAIDEALIEEAAGEIKNQRI